MKETLTQVEIEDNYSGGEVEKLRSRMQLCSEILQSMRHTDDVSKTLETVVIKLVKLLNAVHVSVYKLSPITHTVGRISGQIVAEAIASNCDTCSQIQIENILNDEYVWIQSTKGEIFDLYAAGATRCEINLTEIFAGKAYLLVPIVLPESDRKDSLWGFLTVHNCSAANSEPFKGMWDQDDVLMLQQIAMQIEIMLQQKNHSNKLLKQVEESDQAHTILHQRMQQYRTLVEEIPNVSYVSPIANTPEFAYISPQLQQLLGVPSEEWNAGFFNSWANYVHPDDRDRVQKEVGKTIETGEPFCSEYRFVSRNGKIIWVRDNAWIGLAIDGKTKVLRGSAFDISDRKESDLKFKAIFNNSFQFVGLLSVDGILLETNQTSLDFCGITRDEVIGKPFWETYWFSHSEGVQNRIQQSVRKAAHGEFIRYEVDIVGEGGIIVPIDFSIRPLKDESGEVVLLIPEGRDISEFKAIEQNLRNSEARLVEAQQLSKIGNWEWDVASDTIIWSQELFRIYSRDPELGTPTYEELLQFDIEEDREKHAQAVQLCVSTGESYYLEFRILRPNASYPYTYIDVIGHAECDEHGKVIRLYGTAQDITDRKLIEQNLRDSEARLVEAQSMAKIGNWEWEVASDTTFWSQELFRIYGRDPALGAPAYEEVLRLYIEEDREKHAQAVQLSVSTGESYHLELRMLRPDGSYGYIEALGHAECDEHGKVIRLYGTAQDITDRKLIEQNLRDSEARLVEAQTLAKLGNWQWDLLSNKVTGSDEYLKILGLDPSLDYFFFGEVYYIFVQEDLESLELAIDRARKYGESYCRELRIPLPDNSYRYLEAVGHAKFDANGKVTLLYGTLQDISDRKKIEAKLEAAKVAEATIQAKAEFLAVMSHELRTPMNAVIGMTEVLRGTPLSIEQQQYLATIRQGGEILLSVVNNVLDFSQIETGHLKINQHPFAIQQCVEDVLELMTSRIAEKSLELSALISLNVPKQFVGDYIRVRQILINLVSNAIKFTKTGEVVITVNWENGTENESKLLFAVRDTGVGIAPEELNNLFQAFSQANSSIARQYGGTGLGLVISKQLCELMGGRISVNSTVGEGSTFSFSIMASAIAEVQVEEPISEHTATNLDKNISPSEEIAPNLEGKRILLVCSNPTIGQAIVMYTQTWQISTQIAQSGSDAMLLFHSTNFDAFDAVLIDENLVEMDALELANDIHQIFPDLKLVLLTFVKVNAITSENTFERAKRNSAFADYINKPITSSKLYQTLINTFYPEQAKPIPDNINPSNISSSNPELDIAKENPLSVLIVEDNPVNQLLLLKMLKKLGYQAEAVGNGQKGVEAMTQKPYEIIFMDFQMPIMDGLTATTHIRQLPNPQPWIIGLSANSFAESHKSALAVGMDECLSKPLLTEDLIAALNRVPKSVSQEVLQIAPKASAEKPVSKPNNSSIDLAIFTSIENSVGKDNLLEIIDDYFNQAEQEIANMRDAFNNHDIVTLEINNHSLQGGSGLFGATKLLNLCQSLQFMCRICIETNQYAIDDIDQIGIVLENIAAEYNLVKQAFEISATIEDYQSVAIVILHKSYSAGCDSTMGGRYSERVMKGKID